MRRERNGNKRNERRQLREILAEGAEDKDMEIKSKTSVGQRDDGPKREKKRKKS